MIFATLYVEKTWISCFFMFLRGSWLSIVHGRLWDLSKMVKNRSKWPFLSTFWCFLAYFRHDQLYRPFYDAHLCTKRLKMVKKGLFWHFCTYKHEGAHYMFWMYILEKSKIVKKGHVKTNFVLSTINYTKMVNFMYFRGPISFYTFCTFSVHIIFGHLLGMLKMLKNVIF